MSHTAVFTLTLAVERQKPFKTFPTPSALNANFDIWVSLWHNETHGPHAKCYIDTTVFVAPFGQGPILICSARLEQNSALVFLCNSFQCLIFSMKGENWAKIGKGILQTASIELKCACFTWKRNYLTTLDGSWRSLINRNNRVGMKLEWVLSGKWWSVVVTGWVCDWQRCVHVYLEKQKGC